MEMFRSELDLARGSRDRETLAGGGGGHATGQEREGGMERERQSLRHLEHEIVDICV